MCNYLVNVHCAGSHSHTQPEVQNTFITRETWKISVRKKTFYCSLLLSCLFFERKNLAFEILWLTMLIAMKERLWKWENMETKHGRSKLRLEPGLVLLNVTPWPISLYFALFISVLTTDLRILCIESGHSNYPLWDPHSVIQVVMFWTPLGDLFIIGSQYPSKRIKNFFYLKCCAKGFKTSETCKLWLK